MDLNIFNNSNLYEAIVDFFAKLNIPLNSNTTLNLNLQNVVLGENYKNREPFTNVTDTYFAGRIDDSIFQASLYDNKISYEDSEKVSANYSGLRLFALKLNKKPTRSEISELTRAFNRKSLAMPVALALQYDKYISLALPERFLYKQSWRQGEKVGKTIILRDINTEKPHRGHIDILKKLSEHKAHNFNELNEAWKKVLDIKTLNDEFYYALAGKYDKTGKLIVEGWYQKCFDDIKIDLTKASRILGKDIDNELRPQVVIRIIVRMMFIWFMKQKGLIANIFFEKSIVNNFLKNENIYYNAILQNLFFAVLNKKIDERRFRKENPKQPFNPEENEHGVFDVMRYKRYFKDGKAEEFLALVKQIPFVNGGLFQCHDYKFTGKDETGELNRKNNYLIDAFSETKPAKVSDDVMFSLIDLFNSYVWTIEESTPEEQDVALDPELLGTVFENIIGVYNPESKENARKSSGSFYTPKAIVDYMCRESLRETCLNCDFSDSPDYDDYKAYVNFLFDGKEENHTNHENHIKIIVQTITDLKILDPACGSGAFPVGMFNLIIKILGKIDPDNRIWKEVLLDKAEKEFTKAGHIAGQTERDAELKRISDTIENNSRDYGRKIFIIQNCIYGIDIQNIAIEISKLRFFISLLVDYETPDNIADFDVLPNLETKFAVANTLIGIEKKKAGQQIDAFGQSVDDAFAELTKIFLLFTIAKTPKEKEDIKNAFEKKKAEIINDKNFDFGLDAKDKIRAWNPFNVCYCSPFFDSGIMFGIQGGFDIVIGNPPYVQLQNNSGELAKLYEKCGYKTFARTGDLYCLFYERGYQLLKPQGRLCFITSNKWMRAGYGENTRKFFAENTNPEQLIDFAGVKVFESATVDTNILMFAKDKNRQQTQA
ncbi:MAG: Eco57I restriction-modification methylase domain-containing protein, partial [Tannerellaceae bacterium]|nr:Eco57I restriction-modification methylase domain-containing protein [Tannerellaceae bacterium]